MISSTSEWYYGRAMGTAFTYLFVLSAVIGLILSALPDRSITLERKRRRSASIRRFDAAALVLLAGLLGSKVFSAVIRTEGPTDLQTLLEPGGGSLLGGLAAGAAGFCLYAWLTNENGLRLVDGLALPAVVLAFGSWIGCALSSCAYGRRTSAAWFSPPGPDYLGIVEPRWPTQTIGALSALAVLAALLFWIPASAPPGYRAAFTGLILGLSLIGIAALRGDPVSSLAGLRVDSLAGILLLAIGIATGAAALISRRRTSNG